MKLNFAYVMTYRANFINSIISALGWGIFQIVWIFLLTSRNATVFGWRRDEMITLAIGYIILLGVYHFLFSRNFASFSRIIDRGEFDSILIKPIDPQFQISSMLISYPNSIRALVGVLILIWWAGINHYSIGLLQICDFILLLGVGVMTIYSIWFIFATILI